MPLIIGEFDASPTNCEAAARWKYTDYFVRQAASLNTSVVIWDNGIDHFDRVARTWRDPTSISILMNAVKGVPNSLADSTTDLSAPTQSSSAFIFHRVGDTVDDQALPFILHGNELTSIELSSGTRLTSPADYTVSGPVVTFKSAFLAKYVSPTASPGVKANLTLAFSGGAPLLVEIVQWNTPTLSSSSSKAAAGADLSIPIAYQGLNKPAAVRVVESDGTILADTWTKWLGPLQQGRAVSSPFGYPFTTTVGIIALSV